MHWLHSVDQLVSHVGSTSHTVDEYYRVLCELLEDRQFAVVSAFAEAKRCEGANILDEIIAKDKEEKPNHRLKAEANLLQNKSRSIIATPALDAARLEIWAIQTLLSEIESERAYKDLPAPLAHQKIQYYENILDLAWKAFVEFKSYGALSPESNAQMLARGLEFKFDRLENRAALYAYVCTEMGWAHLSLMSPTYLNDLRETVNSRLESSDAMQKCIATHNSGYMEAMQNGIAELSGIGISGPRNQIPTK